MQPAQGDRMSADDRELARRLEALEDPEPYQVEEVLKESPDEVTQLVSTNAGGARWTFVRKLIRHGSGLGDAYRRIYRAQREGARFRHVPAIRDCHDEGERLVVVMELVPGETLQDQVSRMGASVPLARRVFPLACDAASELHERFDPPLIHRDLKPSNIMVSPGGLALIDFGIARDLRGDARADTTRFGTPSFAPPEQFGFGETTARSDVYALGMLLYFCLVGDVPDTYVAPGDLARNEIPAALQGVIARATAMSPEARHASARDLKADFLRAVGGPPQATRAPGGGGGNGAPAAPPSPSPGPGGRGTVSAQPPAGTGASPGRRRFSALGRAWNALLLAALAILLYACGHSFFHPTATAGYPVWLNAVAYLFLMPLLFVTGAWALFDKRRLAERFPALQRYRARHWIGLFAIAFIAMFLVIGLGSQLAR